VIHAGFPSGTAEEQSRVRLVLAFVAVYVVWGSTYLFIRWAVETLPPFLMAGARFAVAGAILYAWAKTRGAPTPSRPEVRGAAIAGLFLLLGGNGAVVWAEQRVPSAITALLVATVPVWMVLLDWLRPGGVRPRAGVFGGLALGLAGLALLVGRGAVGAESPGADMLGAGVLVVGSILWAVGSLYVRQSQHPSSAMVTNAVQMLSGGCALVVVGLAVGELGRYDLGAASSRSLLSLLYLVVAGSLIGFTAYTYLLQHTTPAKASTYAYVNPVVAVLLGWAFAGEAITARTLIAAAVILAGVAIITMAGGTRSGEASQPSDARDLREREGTAEGAPKPRRRVASS
jgi:drug/metabolite transporter (DMT)-like permease